MRVARIQKQSKKLWRKNRTWIKRYAPVSIMFLLLGGIIGYRIAMPPKIDQALYRPLLNTIAKGESNGNYNAYFGNSGNQEMQFTTMTIAEVLDWQSKYVDQGSPSSAVGRYQIIRPTLVGLVEEQGIKPEQVFDETLQDNLAIALMERRGSLEYVQNKISQEEFAANLAKEWAALPKVLGGQPTESYYADDGLNKARIGIDEILTATDQLKPSS